MSFTLVFTDQYSRRSARFLKRHPQVREQYRKTLLLLVANPHHPSLRLHALGGKRWASQRDKTRAAIQEMTVELLDLYARRKVATRAPHFPDTVWQRQLESSFLFEDTPDQRTATTA